MARKEKTFELTMLTAMSGPDPKSYKGIGEPHEFPASEAERLIDYGYAEPVDEAAWKEHMDAKTADTAKKKQPRTATAPTPQTTSIVTKP